MHTGSTERGIAAWLLACAALVWAMTVLGGVTRLAGAGLSIVEWAPLAGILPPLGEEAWAAAHEAYLASPEGRLVNAGLTLAGFRAIFWIEWAHRLLGRLIGVAYALPLAWFFLRGRLPERLVPRLLGLLGLGALQGVVGWLMVKSGLVDVPHVSPYRLALHLGLGLVLFAGLIWTALDVARPPGPRRLLGSGLGQAAALTASGVFLTSVVGAFVAGTKAGLNYNTFPLMAGALVPDGLLHLEPGWRNLFENAMTVQFVHRWLALLVLVGVLGLWVLARRAPLDRAAHRAFDVLALAALVQVSLGVATLLLRVPVVLAAAHQGTALLFLAAALVAAHRARAAAPASVAAPALR